jgi:hypothetical protein
MQVWDSPCPTNYAVALRYTLGCDVCHCPRLFDPVSAPKDSKAASAPTLSGFAFVPLNLTVPPNPSHGIGRVVELAVEQGEMMLYLSPSFANTAQSD